LQLRDHSERRVIHFVFRVAILKPPGEYRQSAAGVGTYKSQVASACERAIDEQTADRTCHVEIEFGGEIADARHQVVAALGRNGMDEDFVLPPVELVEDGGKRWITQIHISDSGIDTNAIGLQRVEGVFNFF